MSCFFWILQHPSSITYVLTFRSFVGISISGPYKIPTKTNNKGNQSLMSVRNVAVESDKNITMNKIALQPAGSIRNPRLLTGILRGGSSIQMAGLGGIFQVEEDNFMLAEAMEEYKIPTTVAA